jgi:transcriptional regulator GlxA family with amidase domain
VSLPPLDSLTDWRISVAQTFLKRGEALKAVVAPAVGYSSPADFTRCFARRVSATVLDWAAVQRASAAGE